MSYSLGIDLGTTFSAAAVHRDGRARIVELGSRSASIPSVVFLRDDETVLAGEAAQRRAAAEPQRVAREFKRRIGDPTPLLLGGAAYSAEALSARLLRWIVDQVIEREGGPPDSIAITHPANWGPYKIDLLRQAIRLADLDRVELITEPEAAARHYASHERVDDGSIVAVYDLGGGTFDAAILRKTADGFEALGRPEGVERLGGIDFDAAVLGHVVRSLEGAVEELDPDDSGAVQALARLRQDCVDAKEGLSGDTDVSIPVLLPTVQTDVRLTRSEFEAMIRPALSDSLAAMRRAIESAGVAADDISAVLLVGGSSRIPIVAQLVSNEFGRPVAVDADPKHAIALGAALVAHDRPATDGPVADTGTVATAAATAAAAVAEVADDGPRADTVDAEVVAPAIEHAPAGTAVDDTVIRPEVAAVPAAAAPIPAADRSGNSKLPILIGAGVAAVVALVAGIVIVGGSGGDSPEEAAAAAEPTTAPTTPAADETTTTAATTTTVAPTTTVAATTTAPTTSVATTTTVAAVAPPVTTPCPAEPARTVCIDTISVDDDGGLVAAFTATGYLPELEPIDYHVHFYFDSVVGDDERNAGSAGSGGDWRLWDAPNPFVATGGDGGRPGYTAQDARDVGATQLCAIVADTSHAAVVGTGNCIELPDEVTTP